MVYRFDVRRAYKLDVMQKLRDTFGIGGHVYGFGAYFAAEALYSHWWSTRVWDRTVRWMLPTQVVYVASSACTDTVLSFVIDSSTRTGDRSEHKLILAHVFTGKCKDFGREWAPELQVRHTVIRILLYKYYC